MASIGHLAAGALVGAAYAKATNRPPVPAMAAFAGLALAPDLDLLTMPLVAKDSALDHRVLTHSLVMAPLLGGLIGLAFGKGQRALLAIAATLALASHGLLDAATQHGPGPMLLWPLDHARHAFDWRPIPGAQGFEVYFSRAVWPIVAYEALLFLPVMAATLLVLGVGRRLTGRPSAIDTGEMATVSEIP